MIIQKGCDDMKHCSDPNCTELNPQALDKFYSKKAKNNKLGEYTYYNPECKSCTKRRVRERLKNPDNYKKAREWHKEYRKTEKFKKWSRQNNKEMSSYQKEWRNKNKDKMKEYQEFRNMNKKHDISKTEWESCLSYFNNTCAYCGISNDEAKNIYGRYLNKEHVIHNGKNDLTNNVPACTSCNTSKRQQDMIEWYLFDFNKIFDEDRLDKILKWLDEDCHKCIEKIE